ncbi:hypothetical protein [Paenibacillus xylaniclasticus]|uniref:hypothetical protein n=1 Tax=Paenibacillus xylaniclasticus TaxID=588083 RepID=UPI000FD8CBB8|nr:hypothetical protein [Paenibacillus xylaniclasticus]
MNQSFQQVTLRYLHTELEFRIEDGVSLEPVFEFFGTHFEVGRGQASDHPLAVIQVIRDGSQFDHITWEQGDEVYIRKSTSSFFTIRARRIGIGETEYFRCDETGICIAMDKGQRTIIITGALEGSERENLVLIELIRDLVLKNEENYGVVVVHATCAYRDDEASIIVGQKGAGKSTTLLELVHRFHFLFMSGDKTLVWADGGKLYASGWPDYPHLGLGTMSKYSQLVEIYNLADSIAAAQETIWSGEHKIAASPDVFKTVIPMTESGLTCPIGRIVYPQLYQSERCEARPVTDHIGRLIPHVERMFSEGAVLWNSYVEPSTDEAYSLALRSCLELLGELPAVMVEGSGVIKESDWESAIRSSK